jgi:hypothetical protein
VKVSQPCNFIENFNYDISVNFMDTHDISVNLVFLCIMYNHEVP